MLDGSPTGGAGDLPLLPHTQSSPDRRVAPMDGALRSGAAGAAGARRPRLERCDDDSTAYRSSASRKPNFEPCSGTGGARDAGGTVSHRAHLYDMMIERRCCDAAVTHVRVVMCIQTAIELWICTILLTHAPWPLFSVRSATRGVGTLTKRPHEPRPVSLFTVHPATCRPRACHHAATSGGVIAPGPS